MSDMALALQPLIPALRRYARGLLREPAAADDLVQDSLEHAVGAWGQRRPGGEVRSWVFTILHNLAVNRLRQAQRRGPHLSIDDAGDAVLAGRPTQEDGFRQRDILEALAALPDEYRHVLLLISVERLSYAEVATVLGVPVGTVMSRISRARERLRRIMAAEPAEAPRLRRVK